MNKKVLIPLALSAALLGLFFFTRYGLPQFYTRMGRKAGILGLCAYHRTTQRVWKIPF